jgi:predicted kinase
MIGGPVGTVLGAGAGIVFGMATSGALDATYDRLPDGTQKAIEDGFHAIGDGVGDAADATGDTAKKVWNSIF